MCHPFSQGFHPAFPHTLHPDTLQAASGYSVLPLCFGSPHPTASQEHFFPDLYLRIRTITDNVLRLFLVVKCRKLEHNAFDKKCRCCNQDQIDQYSQKDQRLFFSASYLFLLLSSWITDCHGGSQKDKCQQSAVIQERICVMRVNITAF